MVASAVNCAQIESWRKKAPSENVRPTSDDAIEDRLMMRRQNMDLVQQAIHADATTSGIMILASGGKWKIDPAGLKSGIVRG